MSDKDTMDPEPANDAAIGRALDAWTPMQPPADFVDRVLAARVPIAARSKRAWLLAAPVAAAAMIVIVLFAVSKSSKEAASPRAENVATLQEVGNGAYGSSNDVAAAGSGSSGIVMNGSAGVSMNQPVVVDAGVAMITQPPLDDPEEIEPQIRAGESVSIHDASPSARVQITFSRCTSEMTVTAMTVPDPDKKEIARGRTRVTLTLSPGTWTYIAECSQLPGEAPTGTISVVQDDAHRPLRTTRDKLRNDIDADGRTWRISYQTRIPDVRVRVPAGTTKLAVNPDGGVAIELPVRDGFALIPSSKLAKNKYTLRGEPATNATKTTTLIIDFDSTAPQLYLANLTSGPGGGSSLVVTGTTVPGWTLSIRGVKVPIDARARFKATTRGFGRLVIRAEHPHHGVHFYVTRPITF